MTPVILFQIIVIVFSHWIADFLLQTHEMSINKSKSNYWLSLHVFYYTMGISGVGLMLWYFVGFYNWYLMLIWVLLNGALHWITDYNTSRWTSKLWAKQEVHNFFVVIGLDQLIHYICLFGTYVLLTQEIW